VEQRVLGFVHESDINNRICKACYEKNYKLLKQRLAMTVANDAREERANQGTKRARDIVSKMSRNVVRKQQQAADGLASLYGAAIEEMDDVEGKLK
jgi:ribosomal protein S1